MKVESHTLREKDLMFSAEASTERARFGRLCIEVDLRKSLVSKFLFNGKEYMVEYEGLNLKCFQCGCFGHKKEQCSIVAPEVTPSGGAPASHRSQQTVVAPEFGPWMMVKKTQRSGAKGPRSGGKAMPAGGRGGSRFAV